MRRPEFYIFVWYHCVSNIFFIMVSFSTFVNVEASGLDIEYSNERKEMVNDHHKYHLMFLQHNLENTVITVTLMINFINFKICQKLE